MHPSTRRILQTLANVGLAAALIIGTLPFGMRAYGHWTQSKAKDRFAAQAAENAQRADATPKALRRPARTPPRRKWETAIVQIPSINVEAVVSEGSGTWELVIGPGHEPRSAGAGGAGNCVIAAHRNMWDAAFADLPKVKPGDLVYVITSTERHTYVIDRSREIKTSDKSPLRDSRDARVTLITCVLPFDSHRRWVVQGHLVEDTP